MDTNSVEHQEGLELAAAEAGLYRIDLDSGLVVANSRFFDLLDLPPGSEQVEIGRLLVCFTPDSQRTLDMLFAQARARRIGPLEQCLVALSADGNQRCLLNQGQVLIRTDKVLIVGSLTDVSRLAPNADRSPPGIQAGQSERRWNPRKVWEWIEQAHREAASRKKLFCLAVLAIPGPRSEEPWLTSVETALQDWGGFLTERGIIFGPWQGDEFLAAGAALDEPGFIATIEEARNLLDTGAFDTGAPRRLGAGFKVGIACSRSSEETSKQLLARAKVALSRTTEDTPIGTHDHADPAIDTAMPVAILVQDAVRSARITPALQPFVCLNDRARVAEESFARILQPDQRTLNAAAFIEVAQQLGLLHRIDAMLFMAAQERISHPPRSAHQLATPLPIFVHASADLMEHRATVRRLTETLEASPLPSSAPIVLTLKETLAANSSNDLLQGAAGLLQNGCALCIGGFRGETDYQGLLARVPARFLTFDPGLIQSALESPRSRDLVTAVAAAAADQGVITIAKQIQDQPTLDFVEGLGIRWGQGYLLAVPSDPTWALSSRPPRSNKPETDELDSRTR